MLKKNDVIELDGEVVDISRDNIKVKLSNGHIITAYLSGKLRIHCIKILFSSCCN